MTSFISLNLLIFKFDVISFEGVKKLLNTFITLVKYFYKLKYISLDFSNDYRFDKPSLGKLSQIFDRKDI